MTLNDLEPSERKRLARSSGLGIAFWALTLVAVAFVPVTKAAFPEPDYPPVSLTLTSPVTAPSPVRQIAPTEEIAPTRDAPANGAPARTEPAKTKAAPAAKAAAPDKTSAAKSAPASKSAPIAKSAPASPSGGLGIPDFDVPVTSSNKSSGESEFLDFSSARQTQNPVSSSLPPGGNPRSELEGNAATAATGKTSGATVSSKAAASAQSGAASSATTDALKGVEGAAASALSPSGSAGSSGASGAASAYADTATTSAGRVSSVAGLSFDGQPRTLIYPDDPRITLPDRLARLVDSNRTVTVQFIVRKDGSVPGTLVTFTPLASLPAEIRDYLRAEFARWRFEAGDQDGQARFSYSIKLE